MNGHSIFEPAALVTVTVTFNPDLGLLHRQLIALPAGSLKLIVDNGSETRLLTGIRRLVASVPQVQLLANAENRGLAAAVNQGARLAQQLRPCAEILLLDQDSEPMPGSLEALFLGLKGLRAQGLPVACVGPSLVDAVTGLAHGFHQATQWRWNRVYPPPSSAQPVRCANLNGSGTLVSLRFFLDLGGLEESLFVDHVDTEWAFRVQSRGYQLYGVPNAVFRHRMGEASCHLWFTRRRVWPVRSPRRHYFLFRNAVVLMRRGYVPRVWKIWAAVKLALTVCITVAIGPQRCEQLKSMWGGVRDSGAIALNEPR